MNRPKPQDLISAFGRVDIMYGYHGRILRVNLTIKQTSISELSENDAKKYVGGTGFGARILYQESPPGTQWNDAENRIVISTGPLNGTIFMGSGTFTLVTKGPMTNMAVDTQACGFLGAFLKLAGFDAVVIHGEAEKWSYLFVHDEQAEIRDASHLLGMDTWRTEEKIKEEIGIEFKYAPEKLSVYSIGPAGEKLVRFAVIVGDKGHVCSKGGNGAVFGSKKLKAVVVGRGKMKIPVKDEEALTGACKKHWKMLQNDPTAKRIMEHGTGGVVVEYARTGILPVKNYTTSIFPREMAEKLSSQYMRTHFDSRKKTCWACRIAHNRYVKIGEKPYADFQAEEPEYEVIAAFGPQIWQQNPEEVVVLGNLADRLGIDANESGWVLGFAMECYDRGILSERDLDGIKLTWGNAKAAKKLLNKIAVRDGVGRILAEGVKEASRVLGGQALDIGIYTLKGTTPRSHDHRSRWPEMLDNCTTSVSTIEAQAGIPITKVLGKSDINMFDPNEVAVTNAAYNGWHIFENSLVVCRFCVRSQHETLLRAVNAATGWSLNLDDAITTGKRTINLMRAFDIRHGLDASSERPSTRYGSTPKDGPAAGIGIMKHIDGMVRMYRREMGWDDETGRPLPDTLRKLGLDDIIKDIW